jgi:Ni,Fe-hydrogenase III large subunit
MREYRSIAGVFQRKLDGKIFLYEQGGDGITAISAPPDITSILNDNKIPLWLIRHSFGKPGGEENFFSQDSDRASRIEHAKLADGNIRDLFYRGLSVPVSPSGYVHAVGPIHAGIIEPGHFRFSLVGEIIQSLDIRLGFQRRGLLQKFEGMGTLSAMPLAEAISGDSTVAYAEAFSQCFEQAFDWKPSSDLSFWNCLLLEIERIGNHIGDLGAISADIGYYPLAGVCASGRGVALSCLEKITGSRFARGSIWPGQIRFKEGLNSSHLVYMTDDLAKLLRKVEKAFHKATRNASLRERLQACGTLHIYEVVREGIVGLAARSAGFDSDLRRSVPSYHLEFPLELDLERDELQGDVWARFYLRYMELRNSMRWCIANLSRTPLPEPAPLKCMGVREAKEGLYHAAVEGWRGSVLVVIDIDREARLKQVYVRDPSVLNWRALELAVRGQLIGDFPVTNKSFNLSYSGFDL